jgi:hypothetical protein
MEAEKTRLLVAIEAQKVVQNQAETEKMKATIGTFTVTSPLIPSQKLKNSPKSPKFKWKCS